MRPQRQRRLRAASLRVWAVPVSVRRPEPAGQALLSVCHFKRPSSPALEESNRAVRTAHLGKAALPDAPAV